MSVVINADSDAGDAGSLSAELDRLQERLWVLEAQHGKAEAFHKLVARYERQLLYYLSRFLGNREDALEALQEVWISVFRGLKNLRSPEAFRVWLYQTARGRMIDRLRQSRRDELVEAAAQEPSFHDEIETSLVDVEAVHLAIGRLPTAQAEVITLRFLEDLSLEEIAATLGCNVGTIKSRLHYAKAALRKLLEDHV